MQYARLQKRDIQDMVNKRAIPGKTLAQSNRTRVSRIAYYGFVQNMIFNTLQQGTFSLLAGDDDELTEKSIMSNDSNFTLVDKDDCICIPGSIDTASL